MDTNVLVAGACRREASFPYKVLTGVLREEIPLMLTVPIALEYLEVLQRRPVMELTGLTHSQAEDLVSELIALSHRLQIHFSWRPNLSDESDNKFVEAAIHGGAVIVSYNVNDFSSGDLAVHGWQVMTPREFLARV